MTSLEKILSGLIAITLIGAFFYGKTCNKQKTVQTIIKDTSTLYMRSENAKFKSGNDKLSTQILLLSDSIEKLKGSLKTTKTVYKEKYIYLKENVTDSMCMETLNWANQTITQQDSIITIQSIQIGEYQFQVENLTNQVKFLNDVATKCSKKEIDCFAELSKFDHKFLRWYHKKRR